MDGESSKGYTSACSCVLGKRFRLELSCPGIQKSVFWGVESPGQV